MSRSAFEEELRSLLNCHSLENESNTPDFILANFMIACLDAFNEGIKARDGWYGVQLSPGIRTIRES